MMSNSPRRFPSTRSISSTIVRALRQEFVGPHLVTETVENPIHHLGLLVGEKCMRDIVIFRDRDARRHVAALEDLIGAGAENGAENRIDAGEPPALGKLLVDQGIDLELLAHHALDQIAEEGRLGIAILAA